MKAARPKTGAVTRLRQCPIWARTRHVCASGWLAEALCCVLCALCLYEGSEGGVSLFVSASAPVIKAQLSPGAVAATAM